MGEVMYVCPHCHREFEKESELTNHEKSRKRRGKCSKKQVALSPEERRKRGNAAVESWRKRQKRKRRVKLCTWLDVKDWT